MTVPLRAMPRFLKPASVGLAGALLLLSNGFAKAEWPNLLEAKAIAEEGFIYGLPIVMNYAVMYEYSVDKTRDSTRHHSIRSKTKRVSIRTKTRLS